MRNYLFGLALVTGLSGCYKLDMLGERQVLYVKTELYNAIDGEVRDTVIPVQAPASYIFSLGEEVSLHETCCDDQGDKYFEYVPEYIKYMTDGKGKIVEMLED